MINKNWLIFGGLGITAIIALMVGRGSGGNTGSGSYSSDYGSTSGYGSSSGSNYGSDSGYGSTGADYGSAAPAAGYTGYGGRRTKRSKGRSRGTKRGKK